MRISPSRTAVLIAGVAALTLGMTACGDDESSSDTTAAAATDTTAAPETTEAVETAPAAETTIAAETTAAPTTEATASFEGELVGTFSIDPAVCSADGVVGSYFQMVQPGGTVEAGPFVPNADSSCSDPNYTALVAGTDGGLVTGAFQPAPEPAYDDAGNGLAAAIFEPVLFFAVAFAGGTDPAEATPSITATDGVLSGDLSAFTAYYGGASFNQGAPKPDGSGEGPVGQIDPVTGTYVLDWTSVISGGSFDGFTGVWHLEGTFTAG